MPVVAATREAEETTLREVSEVSDTSAAHGHEVLSERAVYLARAAHATPGGEVHPHHYGALEGAPNARSRFIGAHRQVPARETRGPAVGTTTLSPLDEDILFFQEVAAAANRPAAPASDEVVVEAARRRRRGRAPHRAFRLTLGQLVVGGLLLAQLLMVLWLQSQSLALRNKDYRLRREIAMTRELIAQKQNQISQLDSEAHLNQMASELKWDRAPMTNFDKVNDTHRLTPEETAALVKPPLGGTLIAQTN